MKKITKLLFGIITALCLSGIPVFAEEYSTTPVDATLYSNELAVLYADADFNSTIVLDAAQFPDQIPIVVTGITSNGFFQVNLGTIYYVPGNGLYQPDKVIPGTPDAKVSTDANQQRQQEIHNAILALKQQFPEGTYLTNESFSYRLNVIVNNAYRMGSGCAGFAYYVSDAVFGNAPVVEHRDYNNLKVGDILRINNDTHSVVILEVKEKSVIVVEGNYNSSVHWGREMTKSEIQDAYSFIWTRY